MQYGPIVPFSDEIHAQKYRSEVEDFRGAQNRVAATLKDSDDHFHKLQDILLNMRFLPGGRVQAAMGSTKNITGLNCFISGTIQDSFVDGDGNIMQRATEAAATMRMGGGIGYDFSSLRPRGSMIKKLESRSSGAVSFMDIYDAVCRCTASSGHRRGSQMGVLRVDHPDIVEFIHAKNNEHKLTGFNMSIAVTDEFMNAVISGEPFALRFAGEIYRLVDARELWEAIMRSTWDWAEPGVLFIDQINRMNNLYYCETIAATNPCGEQPLPPFGCCLLGSFNLVKYVKPRGDKLLEDIFGDKYHFDWDQFAEDIPHVVRAMDNVIDKTIYPLPEQEREQRAKRRMGIGVTGLANALEALGLSYGSPEFLERQEVILSTLVNTAYHASTELAAEKGAFPLYDKRYLQGSFIKTLTPYVQEQIQKHGIRNSHLTSIAPCGTISLAADNVSSSIEPLVAEEFSRTVIEFDGPRKESIQDYGMRVFGVRGKAASEVSVKEHVDVLVTAQKYMDSAVSKTCNVGANVSWEEFKNIYMDAWQRGAKGCTTYRASGKRRGIFEVPAATSCEFDAASGRKNCE